MAIVENEVDVAFWPGSDAIRWWTVTNHKGTREVLRVDTHVASGMPNGSVVRLLVYLSLPPGKYAHPPLAAAGLRLDAANGFQQLQKDGIKLTFCTRPDGCFTERGLKYEKIFVGNSP